MSRNANWNLLEINTRIWMYEWSQQLGRPARLDDVPDAALDQIAAQGFDAVWLMGVWQTGPTALAVSRNHLEWRRGFQSLLSDLTDEDITGSPFAVQSYTLHGDFGDAGTLAGFRERLKKRGLTLILDFVPNHTALDHRWVQSHPGYFIHGTDEDIKREPGNYRKVTSAAGPRILAHGRDPYFPGWQDTLQLNYRHPQLREEMIRELLGVAALCDGVRCDMAMLLEPDVIQRTWQDRSLPGTEQPVDAPFWPEAIARVRSSLPTFNFLAEVYWDLEGRLQAHGFDGTYDKRLYDRLHTRESSDVKRHLRANDDFQRKSVRFLENHDEPRAAAAFYPTKVYEAAAILTYLLPGIKLFHEGQLDGRRERASVHLRRRPNEKPDTGIQQFYTRLWNCVRREEIRNGRWQLLDPKFAWEGNPTWERFVAFTWVLPDKLPLLIVVNYGHTRGQCYVPLPCRPLPAKKVLLRDLLGSAQYEREGEVLSRQGLYLDMPEWGYHIFELSMR